ncbi:hypothetical protein FM105_02870 [Brevibacterium yomogidense]|uniref:Uncharacterized protein n=1 Tax=Brevibacterium yomogidense TaxID=946573 RepID=A0A1X6X0V8_9MICO|nr:hypothetical protein FM105_02870 [Brevibacterium yomogidense]
MPPDPGFQQLSPAHPHDICCTFDRRAPVTHRERQLSQNP